MPSYDCVQLLVIESEVVSDLVYDHFPNDFYDVASRSRGAEDGESVQEDSLGERIRRKDTAAREGNALVKPKQVPLRLQPQRPKGFSVREVFHPYFDIIHCLQEFFGYLLEGPSDCLAEKFRVQILSIVRRDKRALEKNARSWDTGLTQRTSFLGAGLTRGLIYVHKGLCTRKQGKWEGAA